MIVDNDFKKEVSDLIRKYGIDHELSRPDYLLAEFISDSLKGLDSLNYGHNDVAQTKEVGA